MSDFVIVGAGAIGMLTALALRQRGYAVTLIDRQQAGRESSWAGGGILSPLYPWRYADPVTALAQRSQQLYPALVAELLDETGIDPEHIGSGLLMLDGGQEDAPLAWAGHVGARLQRVGGEAVHAIQPGLSGINGPAWWMPDVTQVRNPRLARALRTAVIAHGVRLIEGTPVERLGVTEGRVAGVSAGGRVIAADAVILAAGAWSRLLYPDLRDNPPAAPEIQPVRGQMLVLQAPASGIERIVMRDGKYLIPRRDGRIVVGSTVEMVGFEKHTTEEAFRELHAFAVQL
ncbi:MAG: FAD-dependent oxidoreductase, partial [Deinococcota bacterium]